MKIYRRFPFAYPSDDAWSSFVLFLLSVFAQNNTRSDGPTNWELHVNFTLCSAVLYNNFELFSLNARDSLEFSCEKFIDNSFRHRMILSNQCIPQSLFSGKYVIRSICPSTDETRRLPTIESIRPVALCSSDIIVCLWTMSLNGIFNSALSRASVVRFSKHWAVHFISCPLNEKDLEISMLNNSIGAPTPKPLGTEASKTPVPAAHLSMPEWVHCELCKRREQNGSQNSTGRLPLGYCHPCGHIICRDCLLQTKQHNNCNSIVYTRLCIWTVFSVFHVPSVPNRHTSIRSTPV